MPEEPALPGTQSLRPGRGPKVPERGTNYDRDPRAPRKDANNTKGAHDDVVGDALVLLHDDVRTASAESTVMETAVFEGVVSGVVNWSRARKASGWKAVAVAGVVLEALVFYVTTSASLDEGVPFADERRRSLRRRRRRSSRSTPRRAPRTTAPRPPRS